MGYYADGNLADLVPEDYVYRAGHRITEACLGHLKGEVERLTPTAKIPEAYDGDHAEWVRDRAGREPGTAKRSWYASDIERTPSGFSGFVDSDDYPTIIFIEDDTRPHEIRPKRATALRFPDGPNFRLAQRVWHPGTQGVHMMRDALADLEVRWPSIAQTVLERMAAEG